jgi:HSP20 family protein
MLARINKHYVPAYWDDFFNDSFFSTVANHANCDRTMPAVNVEEDEKAFRIEVAIPGLSRKDIRIDLENDVLTIASREQEEQKEHQRNYMRREFSYGSFSRSFQLPDTIDQEHIRANHEAGILTIELPKKEEVVEKAPRQIEIK